MALRLSLAAAFGDQEAASMAPPATLPRLYIDRVEECAKALTRDERCTLAARCAERSLHVWERVRPNSKVPRELIKVLWLFLRGEVPLDDLRNSLEATRRTLENAQQDETLLELGRDGSERVLEALKAVEGAGSIPFAAEIGGEDDDVDETESGICASSIESALFALANSEEEIQWQAAAISDQLMRRHGSGRQEQASTSSEP